MKLTSVGALRYVLAVVAGRAATVEAMARSLNERAYILTFSVGNTDKLIKSCVGKLYVMVI